MSTTLATLSTALAGRYTINREIGAGGMATVYLAHDVKHKRNVALKVLNPELGAVLGVERFLSEIQVTANLQHPNLAPLFDSGEAGGLLFYVMPYIEGESLRARLKREKQLPVDEAIRIAAAIAGALDYAHRHKVIHRDLKPENILMHEGQPLIADFGIALAVSNAGGERVTQTGISLGTPQYMSPEQATGDRVVDGRTDIYSLGAMLYEMLVGDPPFNASTAQSIIAKMLTEKPASVRNGRPNVPPHVDTAIARALEKLAADRFTSAKEFADAIEAKGASTIAAAFEPAPRVRPPLRLKRIREVAAWTLVVVLAALIAWRGKITRAELPVIRVNFDLPPGQRIQDVMTGSTIAVSRRGDMVAFTAVDPRGYRTFVRRINELTAREVSTSAGRNLAFSPDSRWLGLTEGNVSSKVAVDGGQQFVITPVSSMGLVYGIAWSETDTIYIGGFTVGLQQVPAGGGSPTPVPQTEAKPNSPRTKVGQRWPVLLPGRRIAFAASNSASEGARLGILDLDKREATEFDLVMNAPLGVIDDYLIYVSAMGGLMAVRLDLKEGKPLGEPIQVEDGVLVDPTGGPKASLSESGTLAYLKGRAQLQPVFVRTDAATPVPIGQDPGIYSYPRLSPDGRQMAISLFNGTTNDIWIRDLANNTFTRLTVDGTNNRPEWTPDGRHVIFIATRDGKPGIYRRVADGSAPLELVFEPEMEPFEAILSPDAKWLFYRTAPGAKFSRDIFAVPLGPNYKVAPDAKPVIVVSSPATETKMRPSPDGKWLAYESNETGKAEIYVRPFPESGSRSLVSDNGGSEPLWGKDGKSIYYRASTGEVVKVDVTTGAKFSIGARRIIISGFYVSDASHASYDIAADGRLVMLKRAGAEAQTIIVHNWAREFREKLAPRR